MTSSAVTSSRERSTRKFGSLSSSPSASIRCARMRTARALKRENVAAVSGFMEPTLTPGSILVQRPLDGIGQVLRLRQFRRVIAGRLLSRDLDMGVGRHEFVGNRDALHNLDALLDECVIFHVTHRNEAVDPPQPEPVDNVRHELLETRVLYAGHTFGSLEIGRCSVAALLPLTRVVN